MQKIKFVFSILVLVFSVVLASLLMSKAALAQCTWMDGLIVVQGFNNPSDYGWLRSWTPGFDAQGTTHCCSLGGQSPSLRGQTASPANDSDPAARPGVNNAIRGGTCPSAYDMDCPTTSCPSVVSCRSFGSRAPAPGPGCLRCGS